MRRYGFALVRVGGIDGDYKGIAGMAGSVSCAGVICRALLQCWHFASMELTSDSDVALIIIISG